MTEQRIRKAKAPVSAHPAFPAIVALWFSALLGIGSLVLPIALFENISEATGLASMVAAAQPPLGVTARIAIALGGAGLGVAIGLLVARRVVAANAGPRASRHSVELKPEAAEPAFAKRPISAHEELGEGGLDADDERRGPLPGRRRALAVTDDSARSEFLDQAPLPGQAYNALPEAEPAAEAEPLDLAAFDAPAPVTQEIADEVVARSAPEPVAPFGTASLSAPPIPGAPFTAPLAHRMSEPEESVAAGSTSTTTDEQAAPSLHERPLAELGVVELVERFARALQQHRDAAPLETAVAAEADPVVDVTFAFAAKTGRPEIATLPEPVATTPAPPPEMPAALRPLAIDAFADAEDEDEDGELPELGLALPAAKPFSAPAPQKFAGLSAVGVADESDDEADDEAGQAECYPSLLAMKSPLGLPPEPVRIEDPADGDEAPEPVVVFPGQGLPRTPLAAAGPARGAPAFEGAPAARPFDPPAVRADSAGRIAPLADLPRAADTAATERALREALEKLQRMSGAA